MAHHQDRSRRGFYATRAVYAVGALVGVFAPLLGFSCLNWAPHVAASGVAATVVCWLAYVLSLAATVGAGCVWFARLRRAGQSIDVARWLMAVLALLILAVLLALAPYEIVDIPA